MSLYALKTSNDLVTKAKTKFLTLIERVIGLRKDIEVVVVVRVLLLIVIGEASSIGFESMRFNEVL